MIRQMLAQVMLLDAETVDAAKEAATTAAAAATTSTPLSKSLFSLDIASSNHSSREAAPTSAGTNNSALVLLKAFCAGTEPFTAADSNNTTASTSRVDDVIAVIFTRVIVALAAFGLLGNALNLVVLTLRGRQSRGRMERFAYTGLTALALADGLFCLTVLPHGVTSYYQGFLFHTLSFDVMYGLYGTGLFNTCVTCSTWLTVMLACGRYLAVCHPVKARQVTSVKTARVGIVTIFIASVLINLPWHWMMRVRTLRCPDGGGTVYALGKGPMRENGIAYETYTWIHFLVVVLVPLLLLIYCNVFMIRALRLAARRRSMIVAATASNVAKATKDSHQGTTLVLILFIVMHITFVAPAEVANFFRFLLPKNAVTPYFNLIVACLNALQTTYFALNFLLYCAINAQFRNVVGNIFMRCRSSPVNCGGKKQAQVDGVSSSARCSKTLPVTSCATTAAHTNTRHSAAPANHVTYAADDAPKDSFNSDSNYP